MLAAETMTETTGVFISYRRDSSFAYAMLIFKELEAHGYDVFMDTESIDSGVFDTFILNQIEARAHFILILTPDTLERCAEPGDWLRREIEQAVDTRRNIIPVMVGGFRFKDNEQYLTGKLAELPRYNGLSLVYEYYRAGMEKLRTRFLKMPVEGKISKVETTELHLARQKIQELAAQPAPTEKEISAEELFYLAVTKSDYGDVAGAIATYTESISLNPNHYKTYYNRGLLFYEKGELNKAIDDFSHALSLQPEYVKALHRRGIAYYDHKIWELALVDLNEAIRLQPERANFYYNRGRVHQARNDSANALADYHRYLEMGGGELHGNQAEVEQLIAELSPKPARPATGILAFLENLLKKPSEPEKAAAPFREKPSPVLSDRDGPTSPLAWLPDEKPGLLFTLEDGRTRRLPELSESDYPTTGAGFGGFQTDVGLVRTTNQDSVRVFFASARGGDATEPEFAVLIVADGMGGHAEGEKASALAAQLVLEQVLMDMYLPMLRKVEPDGERPTMTEILRQAFQNANTEVMTRVPDGGTTLTAAAIIGDLAYIAHIGDSRAYLITHEGIEQLTRDHSLVQRLIELDQLTPAEVPDHPQRDVLYRAIGQSDSPDVDSITRRLPLDSYLLLCTDGLWKLVSDDEIHKAVLMQPSPRQACETLIKTANARGGPDNISVIIF